MKTIFVSSTFRDMHYERDVIHEQVMPALNNIARQYGESVSFCDLRWGVNTGELESEEGSRKVLSVCLKEIDRCRPYMLVILGYRYGWIPSRDMIEDAAGRVNLVLEELEQSVTALEIEYGALKKPEQLGRTLFYFREFEGAAPEEYGPEDARHAAKLETLKGRIRKLAGERLRTYTLGWNGEAGRPRGLEVFVDMVESDVRSLMEDEWNETAALTTYQRDQRGQWEYAGQKVRQFSALDAFISDCIASLERGDNLLAIQGKSGAGKSTIMAKLAQVLREKGFDVLLVFCSTTSLTSSGLELVKYIIDAMEERLDLPRFAEEQRKQPPSEKEWKDRLAETVAAYNARGGKPVVLLIDGVDQLLTDTWRDEMGFVPYNLSPRVRMVLSCLDSFRLYRRMEVKIVEPLEGQDRKAVVEGILQFLGRELDRSVIREIIQKPAANSPLYLSLLLQRLTMMNKADFEAIAALGDGMEAITARQCEIVKNCSDTLEGMCVELLNVASERLGGAFVQMAAEYIAVSRHGLRERDLEGLLNVRGMGWSSLDFARFVQYLSSFFIFREDGRYDFAHQSIRKGLLGQWGG